MFYQLREAGLGGVATVPVRISSFRGPTFLAFQTLRFCSVPCAPVGMSVTLGCVFAFCVFGGALQLVLPLADGLVPPCSAVTAPCETWLHVSFFLSS